MKNGKLIVVFLMSTTLIALELVWTRIFSAEYFYTFAFLTLSLAVLGLSLGGLALRLFPSLNGERAVGLYLSAAGLMAAAGPVLVFRLGLDFSVLFSSWTMIGKFIVTLFILSSSFFFGGLALAMFFKNNHQEIPRIYMADLVGAGAGVALAVVLMNVLGTPLAVFWTVLPILVAAFWAGKGWTKIVPVVLVAAVIVLGGSAGKLFEAKRQERAPVVYKHWDAMAKIKMYNYGGVYRSLNIDNVANTPVVPFDGDWESFLADTTADHRWDIDVGYLIDRFDRCTFLSLGSGGGMDVFQALEKGAAEIYAVEVNPHINKMLLEGDPSGYIVHDSTVTDSTGRLITLPEYNGRTYHDPRVKVVSEDARTFVRRHKNKFDVIYSLSSNTWAALGSGAFALAENYLFTTEAFKDYWESLSAGGFLSMEHQVYMPRLVSEVINALEELGVENPRDHFAVYNLPTLRRNLLLLSKQPLTDELRRRAYGELTPEIFQTRHLLYPPPDSVADNLINRIVTNGWKAEADSANVDISPCTDDRPFIAHMGLWKNLEKERLGQVNQYAEFSGFPMSNITLAIILAVVVVWLIPLNLLPYLKRSDKLRAAPWLYFFLIGAAFMMIEVVLIQKYALFIGASAYSIATVLLTLLVASGIGSRFSRTVGNNAAFAGITLWLALEILVFKYLTGGLTGLTMVPRALVSAALVFPLGFFMGMPFPKATLRVGELVDWGFAVNGTASVLGATIVVWIAFSYGFSAALTTGGLLYLAAWGLLSARRMW